MMTMIVPAPTIYTIKISNTGLNTVAPSDGFIDHRYYRNIPNDERPTTVESGLAQARAYMRWLEVINQINARISCNITNIITTPVTGPFTSIEFDLTVYNNDGLLTNVISPEEAITNILVKALMIEKINVNGIVYQPSTTGYNERITTITMGALTDSEDVAKAAITVTKK